ncbi:hypothetical protein PHMEG_00015300 [Phytophthora megakarya]|uniref:Uncharacterized protein n=1 Tax=Phytophthora megakarya TaxID=4795 RepID=A0A225W1N3_9STRA|nr:hypothetical protein PHMEG_00015300 [Phytophthora megakarya]
MVTTARPPMQRSISDNQRSLRRCKSGLSHGLQMDLKQAVQLEKQELKKMGLVPPPITVAAPLPKPAEDDDVSSPPYWLYRQQRVVRRAASFTSAMPCSPPVPIPQHQEQVQRRYSAAGGLGDHMTHGVDAELPHMSQSQCEARLWDEFWNYKLSFESRESFEASIEGTNAVLKYRCESTETVTEEDTEPVEPEEEEHVQHYGDVFEMDL